MLYVKSFKNYEEFKELFVEVKPDGSRKIRNKVLLQHQKAMPYLLRWRDYYQDRHDGVARCEKINHVMRRDMENARECVTAIDRLMSAKDMASLMSAIDMAIPPLTLIQYKNVHLYDGNYPSPLYDVDNALCHDGDSDSIRYRNKERGKIFKMRASKMYAHLWDSMDIIKGLPTPVKLYWAGDYKAPRFKSWAEGHMDHGLHLVVDDDFETIYTSDRYYSDDEDDRSFGSCMEDDGYHTFYEHCVKAQAASVRDADGYILARAVIFTEVHTGDGKHVYRLLERQYGREEKYKRMLVDMCVRAGYIDGYKDIHAGYNDVRLFVLNDGTPIKTNLWIDCDIDLDDDYVSYQDTFKWYDHDSKTAFNYDAKRRFSLAVTSGEVETEWDEYHDRVCQRVVSCCVHGEWMDVDEDCLDDFVYVESKSDYYHEDDCSRCPVCKEWFLNKDAWASDLTGEDYCSEDCRDEAENAYYVDHNLVDVDGLDTPMPRDRCERVFHWNGDGYDIKWMLKETVTRDLEEKTLFRLEDDFGNVMYVDECRYGLPPHMASRGGWIYRVMRWGYNHFSDAFGYYGVYHTFGAQEFIDDRESFLVRFTVTDYPHVKIFSDFDTDSGVPFVERYWNDDTYRRMHRIKGFDDGSWEYKTDREIEMMEETV